MNLDLLQQSWLDLLVRLEADLPLAEAVIKDLIATYSTSDRHYHNLHHVRYLLELAKRVRHLTECHSAIELAAWFHDYIYDSCAKNNELKSAIYAEQILNRLNIETDIVESVKQMILSTKQHQPLENSIDNLIFLDLDLSILGTSSAKYLEYSAAIRQEYCWLRDREYWQARKQILTVFLSRARIYYTDYFFHRLEQQARVNVANEIEFLASRLS